LCPLSKAETICIFSLRFLEKTCLIYLALDLYLVRIIFLLMHLEIIKHDGPGRLGKLHFNNRVVSTPSIFWNEGAGSTPSTYLGMGPLKSSKAEDRIVSYGTIFGDNDIGPFGILPSFSTGYNVPDEVFEEGLRLTIEFALDHPGYGAVIEVGGKLDLIRRFAELLMDRPLLKISNPEKLLNNHRRLVEIVTMTREIASPNTALYMSDVPPHLYPILAYIGVDMFDLKPAILKSHEKIYLTPSGTFLLSEIVELPCSCSVCVDAAPEEIDREKLLKHNLQVSIASIKEVRNEIRMGTLRELVEERATAQVNAMGALRILDAEKQDFLMRYTPLYPTIRPFNTERGSGC
jgi:hypothetical protein